MAKRGKAQAAASEADLFTWDETITLHGHQVRCLAKGLEVLQGVQGDDAPKPPTYSYKDVAGQEFTKDHDETSVQDPKTSDAERTAWAEYKRALAEYETRQREYTMRRLLMQGIEVLDMPPEAQWVSEYEWLGYRVPEVPFERMYFWVQQEIVKTPEDMKEIVRGVVRAAGADQEVLDRLEDYFRDTLGRPARANAAAD